MEYSEFFRRFTGHQPLQYQERFHKERGELTLCHVPTGLGKTQAVLVDWLYRLHHDRTNTPTRLVWCLPGRALTEQVYAVATKLCPNIRVCCLMGGSDDNRETLAPDEPAVLVGVQDILVSRALNRGYARRPFRWPIDFALLNNDVYWVLDEVQLLGESVATSAQIAGLWCRFGTFGKTQACWLSATLRKEWLRTIDFPDVASVFTLSSEEREDPIAAKRLRAVKTLEQAPESCRTAAGAASFVAARHRPGTLSLVVVNTVDRAREIYSALAKEKPAGADDLLIHSRFRPAERRSKSERLQGSLPEGGRIVVATQAIEAGVDLDADLMVTDLAPYSSLVQRFGRVNRRGEKEGCRIFWVDRPAAGKRKSWAAPYEEEELEAAESAMRGLTSAAPQSLPPVEGRAPWNHVLRRADLLDLFDTSPDLGGNHLDISRFVRSSEDRDVYVFWRKWDQPGAGAPPPEAPLEVADRELCPAPIGDIDWKKRDYWMWETVNGEWRRVADRSPLYPGCILLAHAEDGGYDVDAGWSPESRGAVEDIVAGTGKLEQEADDAPSFQKYRQTLRAHTDRVFEEMDALLEACGRLGVAPYREDLRAAARKHDWGKAHPVMQETLGDGAELLAKSERGGRHRRPYFRHELASALAMLAAGDSDLAAYLAAAHHGRVRVHVRSMPGERNNGEPLVRGIKAGDCLNECDLGGGVRIPETPLGLDVVSLGCGPGGASWTERALRLLDALGPFRLAYLETLLRAADERASKDPGAEVLA